MAIETPKDAFVEYLGSYSVYFCSNNRIVRAGIRKITAIDVQFRVRGTSDNVFHGPDTKRSPYQH